LLAWPSSTSAQETIRDSVNLAITYDPSLDRIKGKGKKQGQEQEKKEEEEKEGRRKKRKKRRRFHT